MVISPGVQRRILQVGVLIIMGILLHGLAACNAIHLEGLPIQSPTPTPTAVVIPSPTPIAVVIPSATLIASPEESYPTVTKTATFFPSTQTTPTNTLSPTLTPSLTPTITVTSSPSPVTITVENTTDGNYLIVKRSTDNLEYRLGPLADGVYAIGPNSGFLVYCTIDGKVYAAKIGAEYLTQIANVKYFTAIRRNSQPIIEIKIFFNTNRYRADIRETKFNQHDVFPIPKHITGE